MPCCPQVAYWEWRTTGGFIIPAWSTDEEDTAARAALSRAFLGMALFRQLVVNASRR